MNEFSFFFLRKKAKNIFITLNLYYHKNAKKNHKSTLDIHFLTNENSSHLIHSQIMIKCIKIILEIRKLKSEEKALIKINSLSFKR